MFLIFTSPYTKREIIYMIPDLESNKIIKDKGIQVKVFKSYLVIK